MPFVLLLLLQSVAPAWDTPKLFSEIVNACVKLQPVLKQVHPNEWKDAPSSAQALWEDAVKANQALQANAVAAAKTPENFSQSLRLLEEIRDLDETLLTLSAAVRQYQNPELSDLMNGLLAEGKPARDAFSQRVLDLATQREEQCEVADHEAQRCRAQLSGPMKQPKR